MDYGFVRGPSTKKEKKGYILLIIDGYTSYLLITDEVPRYNWVFLINDKKPPISIVNTFMEHHDLKSGMHRVRTYQDGELAKSEKFKKLVHKHNYILETIGSDTLFQNALTDTPH